MRTSGMLALLLACAAGTASPALRAQERSPAEVRLQAAIHAEEVEGNLARAIELYRQIVSRYARERDVAARALFYLGRTYEKQGSQEATRAYQRVVREYGDQSQVAAQARARLAALQAPAPAVAGRGPVARRLLSGEDTDINNFVMMVPSPDGRRVAYVDLYVGALHLRDLASGAVEELEPGLPAAWNWSPAWSPDGTRLAFLKAAEESDAAGAHVEAVAILNLASRTVTVVRGTEVTNRGRAMIGMQPLAWSRDGRFLLYRTSPSGTTRGEIGIVPVGGGARRALADSVTGGSLSPDGRYVAYVAGPARGEQVFVQPVTGGARHPITDAAGGYTNPLWSPDGTAIAYQRPDGIWVVPIADGSASGEPRMAYATAGRTVAVAWNAVGGLYLSKINDVRIPLRLAVDAATAAPIGTAEELAHHPPLVHAFAWSPDGQRVAFVAATQEWESRGAAIAVHATDGSSSISHRVAAPDERIQQMWWSGDGREVLYRSVSRDGGTVKALDPSSGQVRELLPRSSSRSAFRISASGRHVLYWDRSNLPDSSQVGWVVAETGRTDGRLVAPVRDAAGVGVGSVAQLSPRGDRLLFTRQADLLATVTGQAGSEAGTLWVVGVDGGAARRVAAALMIRSAVWDPSGRFIAYTAAVDNTTTVFRIVELATGAIRTVPLPIRGPMEFTVTDWSQDGRQVGIVTPVGGFEYWAIDGLLEAGR